MSQIKMNDNGSTAQPPAWKFPTIPVALVAAVLIGLWQYWSWGPYTVTVDAPATKTNDFVVECWYGARGITRIERMHRNVYITGSSKSVKCPRHFLGPFGVRMTASVYHPEYIEFSSHGEGKLNTQPIVLRPQALSYLMSEQDTQAEKRHVLSIHLNRLESYYLPEFEPRERNVLADRYVRELQDFARLAGGINRPIFDRKSMEYIDDLFRKSRP